ncbi:MAG: hypothetical protein ACOYNS_01970 [Bacteroidota bacterium]
MNDPRRPTQQELMEYVDGTLDPQRFLEIDHICTNSRKLQREVALLRMMRLSVSRTIIPANRNFAADILSEVDPKRRTSFWYRMADNSSNIFAMVMVLSLVGMVILSVPGAAHTEKSAIAKTMDSYSSVISSTIDGVNNWTKHYAGPVHRINETFSGKLMLIAFGILFLFAAFDEVIGKRFFRVTNKRSP